MDGFFAVVRRPIRAQAPHLDPRRSSIGSMAAQASGLRTARPGHFAASSGEPPLCWPALFSRTALTHPDIQWKRRYSCKTEKHHYNSSPNQIQHHRRRIRPNIHGAAEIVIASSLDKPIPSLLAMPRTSESSMTHIHITAFGKAFAGAAARAAAASQFSSVHHTSSSRWVHPAGDRKRGRLPNVRDGRRRPRGAFERNAAHNTDIT